MISPWQEKAEIKSPCGRWTAKFGGMEIAMGGPTSGTLELSNGMTLEAVSPSMVFSSDGEILAVPEWTNDRKQRLVLVLMGARKMKKTPHEYRVLELHSFTDGVVKGVDSPVYRPEEIEIDVTGVDWDD